MAAKVGLDLEVVVGCSLKVSRERPGQRLFSLNGEWAAEAAGSGCTVPLPQEGWGWAGGALAVGAGGRSCSGPYCALKQHEIGRVGDQSLGCIK